MRKKKVFIIILTILLLAAICIMFVEKKFSEPYKTIEKLVVDVKKNKSISKYLIEKKDEEWRDIKNKSQYSLIIKDIDWNHFKEVINDSNVASITYEQKYPYFYKIKNFLRKEASTDIYTYDLMGNELNCVRIFMVKNNNVWKTIGSANNRDMRLMNDPVISPSDIEEYFKDNEQANNNIMNYPYIQSNSNVASASICNGVSFSSSFNFGNLDEDTKNISFWYEVFDKGTLLFDNKLGINGLINNTGTLNFSIINGGDSKEKISLSTGPVSVETDLNEIKSEQAFIAINTDKIRIKKNEEIILGFIVWDIEKTNNNHYSFDNVESIIDAYQNKKIFIFKCKYLNK